LWSNKKDAVRATRVSSHVFIGHLVASK